jgi:hypothetical protein
MHCVDCSGAVLAFLGFTNGLLDPQASVS